MNTYVMLSGCAILQRLYGVEKPHIEDDVLGAIEAG